MKTIALAAYLGSYTDCISEIELLIGLKKKGVDLTIAGAFNDQIYAKLSQQGIRLIEDHPAISLDYAYIKRINKLLKEEGYELMHLFRGWTVKNGILSAIGVDIKLLVYYGSLSLHWHDPTAYLSYLSPRVDKLSCNSQSVYEHVRKQLIHKHKAVKIYKGTDPEWFDDVEAYDYTTLGIPEGARVVIMAARNTRVKDLPTFLHTTHYFKREENVFFVLMGGGTDRRAVQKMKNRSPLANQIKLLGFRYDAASLIKGSDAYVQTSLSEGLGRAVAEAMCLSKPVVMTDADGGTELLGGGEAGIVVPKRDAKALAQALRGILADDAKLSTMGRAARKKIERDFTIQRNIDEVYTTYVELLSQ